MVIWGGGYSLFYPDEKTKGKVLFFGYDSFGLRTGLAKVNGKIPFTGARSS